MQILLRNNTYRIRKKNKSGSPFEGNTIHLCEVGIYKENTPNFLVMIFVDSVNIVKFNKLKSWRMFASHLLLSEPDFFCRFMKAFMSTLIKRGEKPFFKTDYIK